MLDVSEKYLGTAVILHDITERKLAEQELEESRHRLKTILEAVQAGIVIIDSESREVIDANPALAGIMGYASSGELLETIAGIAERFLLSPEEEEQFEQTLVPGPENADGPYDRERQTMLCGVFPDP